jgi:hypothetical protein
MAGSGDGDAALAAMNSLSAAQDSATGQLVFQSQADMDKYKAAEAAFEKSAKSPAALLGGPETQQSMARTLSLLNSYNAIPVLNSISAMSDAQKTQFLDQYAGTGAGGFANDPAYKTSRAQLAGFLDSVGITLPAGTEKVDPPKGGGGGGGGGMASGELPPLPNYANLSITDQQLQSRVNALLGRTGSFSVAAPNIQAVGGLTAPTMAGAAQGPAATQGLQADLIAAVQAALANPSRYNQDTFNTISSSAQADLGAQFAQENRALQEQLSRRGLQASSVAARQGESLGERQARVRADVVSNLLQQAATTQATDRAQSVSAAQGTLSNASNEQIQRFNALQQQYATAMAEGRAQDALRIQTEADNLQRGLSSVMGVLSNQMGVAGLQQSGAIQSRQISLQERQTLINLFTQLYGPDYYSKLTAEQKSLLGLA